MVLLEVAVNLFTRTWFRIRSVTSARPACRKIAVLSLIRSQCQLACEGLYDYLDCFMVPTVSHAFVFSSDPNRRTPRCGRRPETALTSLSDVYELPSSKATHPLACRYASMHDLFYTGSTEDGLDNLSYTPRDVNTYEEIVEESSRGHSFSTFR